jgi:hypothetical protein
MRALTGFLVGFNLKHIVFLRYSWHAVVVAHKEKVIGSEEVVN